MTDTTNSTAVLDPFAAGTAPASLAQPAHYRAIDAVVAYLARLGFDSRSDAVQSAAAEVVTEAADSLPASRRDDAAMLRATALRLTIRDLDHWLRTLVDDPELSRSSVPVAASVAARLESGQMRAVPAEMKAGMHPQRFRRPHTILARRVLRGLRNAGRKSRRLVANCAAVLR